MLVADPRFVTLDPGDYKIWNEVSLKLKIKYKCLPQPTTCKKEGKALSLTSVNIPCGFRKKGNLKKISRIFLTVA